MKILTFLVGLVVTLFVAWWFTVAVIFYAPPIKTTYLTTPDPRCKDHEARIKTLEDWAQRQGRRY